MSIPITIYYSILEEDIFNLLHLHLSEQAEQTTLSLEYMIEGTTIEDYKQFEKDAMGNTLYYKILVKDNKI